MSKKDDQKNDFSQLAQKFDLQNIMSKVKSVINPGGQTVEPNGDDDRIGVKMSELSISLQELTSLSTEQAKHFRKANEILNEVYALIQAERKYEPGTAKSKSDDQLPAQGDNDLASEAEKAKEDE